jgi:replicative DNA helicase
VTNTRTEPDTSEGNPAPNIESLPGGIDRSNRSVPLDLDATVEIIPLGHEAAESVLSTFLLGDARSVEIVLDVIPIGDWSNPNHALIVGAGKTVRAETDRIDPVLVADALRRAGHAFPDIAELHRLMNLTASPSLSDFYAAIVRRDARRRRLIEAAAALMSAAMNDRDSAISDAIASIVAETEGIE